MTKYGSYAIYDSDMDLWCVVYDAEGRVRLLDSIPGAPTDFPPPPADDWAMPRADRYQNDRYQLAATRGFTYNDGLQRESAGDVDRSDPLGSHARYAHRTIAELLTPLGGLAPSKHYPH